MNSLLFSITSILIKKNIIVACSVTSLAISTLYISKLSIVFPPLFCLFGGTVLSYSLAKNRKLNIFSSLHLCCLLFVVYGFFKLSSWGQLIILSSGFLTYTYVFPFARKNLRSIPFIKIGIVSICWVMGTVFLPLSIYDFSFPFDIQLISLQYFLWICVLILPFDIRDKASDTIFLRTIPNTLGVKKTKLVGIIAMFLFIFIAFFYSNIHLFWIQSIIALITILFLIFAKEKQSPFYSALFVESTPIIYLILLYLFY